MRPLRLFRCRAYRYFTRLIEAVFGMDQGYSRYESLQIMECENCNHLFLERYGIHTHQDDGDGGVEPVDECPKCGSSQIRPEHMNAADLDGP